MPVESNPVKSGALAGLRVLDFTSRMGGYCGLLLANLGAEVILIEPPGGDTMRGEGPFKDSPNPEGSISFAAYHTNKQGIVLDLESENDRARLRHLVGHADVFIEDRPVAFWQRLGLGYEDLQAINPALVMTSISGFGSTGPYRDFKSPNIVAFAMGGLMNLCGHPERAPAERSVRYRLSSGIRACGIWHLGSPVQPARLWAWRSSGHLTSGRVGCRSVSTHHHALQCHR